MLDRLRSTTWVCLILCGGCHWCDPACQLADSPGCWSDAGAPSAEAVAGAAAASRSSEFEGRTLGLAECILIALERNPQTRVAWQASRSRRFQLGQEQSPFWPQLGLTGGLNRSATIKDRDKGQSPRTQEFASFGVRYLLLDGGLRGARVRGAAAELMATNFQHDTVLQDVALAVELAYHQRLAAKSLVEVAEENVRLSRYNLRLAQARLDSGVAARFDVLTAETEQANADLALVRARSLERIALGQLAQAMGLHVSERFEIEALPQDVHRRERADIEQLLKEAAQARPELQAAVARIAARAADVDAAAAAYFPTVTATADYGWRDDTFWPSGDEWTVGLGVELPLFAGFSRMYGEDQARSEYAAAAAQYETESQRVELEVWTAYSRLIEADEAIEAAKKLVVSAEESLRVATGRYRAGAGDIIELTAAQTARTDAQTQHVRAVLGWYTALARFQRTIGRTLAEPTGGAEEVPAPTEPDAGG